MRCVAHVMGERGPVSFTQRVRSTRLLNTSARFTSVRSPSRSTCSPHNMSTCHILRALPVHSTRSTCLLPYPCSVDIPLSPTYAIHSTGCGLSSSSPLRPPPSHSPASISTTASLFPPFLHLLPARHSFFRLRPYRPRTHSSSSIHLSTPLFCSILYSPSIHRANALLILAPVLGLAFPKLANIKPTFLERFVEASPGTQLLFTFCLTTTLYADGSTLTIGASGAEPPRGVVGQNKTWNLVPLIEEGGAAKQRWWTAEMPSFKPDGAHLDSAVWTAGTPASGTHTTDDLCASSLYRSHSCRAVIDTGTSSLGVPHKMWDAFYRMLKGYADHANCVLPASESIDGEHNCESTAAERCCGFDDLPALALRLPGVEKGTTVNFRLSPETYMQETRATKTHPSRSRLLAERLAFDVGNGDGFEYWILGDTFIKVQRF